MSSTAKNIWDLRSWAGDELASLEYHHALRVLRPRVNIGGILHDAGKLVVNLSSNDYLALSKHPNVLASACQTIDNYGVGGTSSRLVSGSLNLHEKLESELAQFKGFEAGLVFGAGYLANIGALSCIIRRDDVVISDKLVHASLIDGILLSRALHRRFRHNDLIHLRQILIKLKKNRKIGQRIFLVTESVFSMDGDLAPLREIRELASEFDLSLVVDEAHALGVFGAFSEGCLSSDAAGGVEIVTATLSKALGSYGGFVLCAAPVKQLMVNRARPFIFNTAVPPAFVAAALESLRLLRKSPLLGTELLDRSDVLRSKLQSAGLNVPDGQSHIVPLIVGDNEKTVRLARRLVDRGVLAVAIRPPTVPIGTSRLRLSVTLAHSKECLLEAAESIISISRLEGLC